jgi:GT2 family glycosyltransferase
MMNDFIDIVVPVWNRPVESRACLASILEHTPNARLVIVDNGSERETERMLEEFAEALDVRMLLLKNRTNEGFVKAVNRGLSKAESSLVAVVRYNSLVTAQWLDRLAGFATEQADAGIVIPRYAPINGRVKSYDGRLVRGSEVPAADFAALLMRRDMLEMTGGFSEDLEGNWRCLAEFSRGASRHGFRTCVVPESLVMVADEVRFGSLDRRNEHERRVAATFAGVWGEERSFFIHLPKGSDLDEFTPLCNVLLAAARQGDKVRILAHPSVGRRLQKDGYASRHSNIEIHSLPRFMAAGAARGMISASAGGNPVLVNWLGWVPFPGHPSAIPFDQFVEMVAIRERKVFGRELPIALPKVGGTYADGD